MNKKISFSFAINLQTGPKYLHDIAFHFSPSMNSVALNSCRRGTWEDEIIISRGPMFGENPFVKGGAFDII